MSERITNKQDIERFVFAGKAHFTIRSRKTGTRFTFKVSASDDGKCYFVKVLNGPDNYRNYQYMGMIFVPKLEALRWTKKSKVSKDAPSFKAAAFFFSNIGHSSVEFFHEGKCGRCNKKLTVPESIQTGLGPVCSGGHRKPGLIATHEELRRIIEEDSEPEQQELFA